MAQCDDRGNAMLDTFVNHVVVMIDASLIERAASYSEGDNACPGDGKRVIRHAQSGDSGDVLLVKIVVHVRNLSTRSTGSANAKSSNHVQFTWS